MSTPNNNLASITASVVHSKIYANPSYKKDSGEIVPGEIPDITFHSNQDGYSDHAIRRMSEAGVQEYGLDKIYSKLSTETRQILDAINQGWSAGSRASNVNEEVPFDDGQDEYYVLDEDGFMPEEGNVFFTELSQFVSDDGRLKVEMADDGKSFTAIYDKDANGKEDIVTTYESMPKEYAQYASALGREYELTQNSECWVKTREEYDHNDPIVKNDEGIRVTTYDSGYTLTRNITEHTYKTLFGNTEVQYGEEITALINTDGGFHETENGSLVQHDEILETISSDPSVPREISIAQYYSCNSDEGIVNKEAKATFATNYDYIGYIDNILNG